jgi:murein DD-endopeptidase MepM/ murein hydrolase activator NlpD
LPAEKLSIIVIPEGHRRTRRFQLSRGWLKASALLVVLAVGAFAWLSCDCYRVHVDRAELVRLRSERGAYERQLRLLAGQMQGLRQEMVVLANNDTKVRLMTKLIKPAQDVPMGIGGPMEVDAGTELSSLQRQIDEIRQAIEVRRESLEELQGALNDQRSLFAAKPHGKPTHGWLTSGFGLRVSPFSGRRKMHYGLDIAARTGTPVTVTADGVVARVKTAPDFGKLVVVDHGYGYRTLYAHNSRVFVKVGQRVKRGDKISAIGNTGRSTGPHLHYEVHLHGVPINPRKYL